MSLGSMANELTGIISRIPPDYAITLVQRAWNDIQRKNLWSFLLFSGNWTSPPTVNAGLATTSQGSNTITFNAAATTAINAIGMFPSPVTQRQFRIGVGTIYNIWGWDGSNPSAGVATIDRLYQESSAPSGAAYTVYQCYYPAPVKDFWQWKSVVDTINFNDLITTKTKEWLDLRDPQRSIYYLPTHVVPFTHDLNPASSTYQYQLFELWGQPVFQLFQLTYQLYGLRKLQSLVNLTDTLPPEVGEDCVMALAEYYGYKWAEANWQKDWGVKPNFAFLMKDLVSNDPRRQVGLFNRLFREYRMQDRAKVDNFFTQLRRAVPLVDPNGWYSSLSATANPGPAW